jgi:hypothetical protein
MRIINYISNKYDVGMTIGFSRLRIWTRAELW